MSSVGGTYEPSNLTGSNKQTPNHKETFDQPDSTAQQGVGQNPPNHQYSKKTAIKPSYEPVKIAYISYEKKATEKIVNEVPSQTQHEKLPLIIHHGMFGTKEHWKTVSKEINFITKRPVYSVDGRNHGESPHSNEMTYALMAKDVKNFCAQMNQDKVCFMGHHGLGGRIGIMMAMLYPEYLDKLILVDSTPLMSKKVEERYAQFRDGAVVLKDIEPELRKLHGYKRNLAAEQAIDHIVKDKRDIAVMLSNLVNDSSPQNSTKSRSLQNVSDAAKNISASKEPSTDRIWKCNIDAMVNNTGILNFPAFDESKAFHGETLFIQPTKSSYISEGDEAEIRRIFPNAEFRWIKQKSATTYFHVEKHTEFMQSVLGFLHGKDNRTNDDGNEETSKEENTKKS